MPQGDRRFWLERAGIGTVEPFEDRADNPPFGSPIDPRRVDRLDFCAVDKREVGRGNGAEGNGPGATQQENAQGQVGKKAA